MLHTAQELTESQPDDRAAWSGSNRDGMASLPGGRRERSDSCGDPQTSSPSRFVQPSRLTKRLPVSVHRRSQNRA